MNSTSFCAIGKWFNRCMWTESFQCRKGRLTMLKSLMNPPINLNRNSCIIVKQVYWQFFFEKLFLRDLGNGSVINVSAASAWGLEFRQSDDFSEMGNNTIEMLQRLRDNPQKSQALYYVCTGAGSDSRFQSLTSYSRWRGNYLVHRETLAEKWSGEKSRKTPDIGLCLPLPHAISLTKCFYHFAFVLREKCLVMPYFH